MKEKIRLFLGWFLLYALFFPLFYFACNGIVIFAFVSETFFFWGMHGFKGDF